MPIASATSTPFDFMWHLREWIQNQLLAALRMATARESSIVMCCLIDRARSERFQVLDEIAPLRVGQSEGTDPVLVGGDVEGACWGWRRCDAVLVGAERGELRGHHVGRTEIERAFSGPSTRFDRGLPTSALVRPARDGAYPARVVHAAATG
jgi:hypothetical protein